MRDTEKEREKGRDRQREKPAPYREPDMGLDPWTSGSCPGQKAGTKPLSPQGPLVFFLNLNSIYLTYSVLLVSEVEFSDSSVAYSTQCSFPHMLVSVAITQSPNSLFLLILHFLKNIYLLGSPGGSVV